MLTSPCWFRMVLIHAVHHLGWPTSIRWTVPVRLDSLPYHRHQESTISCHQRLNGCSAAVHWLLVKSRLEDDGSLPSSCSSTNRWCLGLCSLYYLPGGQAHWAHARRMSHELLPIGMVSTLPRNKVLELSVAGGSPGTPGSLCVPLSSLTPVVAVQNCALLPRPQLGCHLLDNPSLLARDAWHPRLSPIVHMRKYID